MGERENTGKPMIRMKGLSKHFGDLKAVDDVTLEVAKGEVFGLLGPNGAGKTTTISLLCTLLIPTAGSAEVDGVDVVGDPLAVRKSIGVVFQDPSLDTKLTARENLTLHAMLYDVPNDLATRRIAEVLQLVELTDDADRDVKTFSGGMKRRLEIARGLIHHPRLLFLDEPTLGLDPQTRHHIWEHVRTLNKEKDVTIILTTHYMDEADALCNRIAVIDHGRIVATGSPAELKEGVGGDLITVETASGDDVAAARTALEGLDGVLSVDESKGKLMVTAKGGDTLIPLVVDACRDAKVRIRSVNLRTPTLNDVFLKHTGTDLRAENGNAMDHIRQIVHRRGRRSRS
ncbi:MAG: ATP-binding cassette domain-containing protein [Candidatus Undinarchaeales archaeon]|jgi:ABC-2 type transport system ATP-binding protein|nr:ATP-binding cassette domain-containing protein [Candidatus Undinarchaeales archaeon]MDP7493302.1 ATP-binding cassette domain-containing protein [Candidatus Undinarchaeales archaeon]